MEKSVQQCFLEKKLRKENRSQEGKVKFNFPKRKKGKREPTLSAIKKREDSNSSHEILNGMKKCDGNTMLSSPAHWQADINLEIEDVNLLFVKFTSDYFKNANKELRTKETLLLTWNELIKSKQQIDLCIKNLPSLPICTCSNNNNNVLLFCYACKYW